MNPIILETVDLSLSFGRKQVLKGITVQFPKGESVLIAGKNGTGKSTFLRCLAGVLLPDSGRVVWDPGVDKRRIGFISDSLSFFEDLSVAQGIDLHRRVYRLGSVPDDLLRKVGIDRGQKIRSLSLGERAIFHLTITLAQKPLLLMIDEIIHHMDAYTRELLIEALIESVAALQTTVLMINHTFHDVERIPDRVLLMKDGIFVVDEKTDSLQQRMKKVVLKEPLQGDLPILFSRDSGYFKEYYLYPFAEEMRTRVDAPMQDLALPEILKAFIGGSYERKPA
jgi:ABC-2 type transport system ATP-binding protein